MVGVSPEPVIQLLLVTVQAGAAPGEAVNQSQVSIQICLDQSEVSIQVMWSASTNRRPVLPVHLAGVLHVSTLGVEVGHVPAILLIIVVVGVGAEEIKLDYKTVLIDFVNI